MRFSRPLLLFALLVACALPVRAANPDEMFSLLAQKVDTYLDLDQRAAHARNDTWHPQPFADTKSSIANDLNKLLDEALKALLDDDVLLAKRDISRLMQRNTRLQEDLANLELQRLTAPPSRKRYEIWKSDVQDIEQSIADKKSELEANKNAIANGKQAIRARLRDAGIDMTEEEVESLINTVTGTDTLQAMVVLKNVQTVLEKLKTLLGKEHENIHIAKKYYGLFLLSTQAYLRQLELFSSRITEQYIPKLQGLRADNTRLMDETRKLSRTDKKYLNNLNAQKITDEAARTYEKVLQSQARRIQDRKIQVGKILKLADNTYKTVSLAHSLYESMSECLDSYESMMSLPLLDPIPFENRDLELKYLELTRKLEE